MNSNMTEEKLIENSIEKFNTILKGCTAIQNTINLGKLKQGCHYEERMKIVKEKRENLIRENITGVDVEDLRPDLLHEIGTELEKIEKGKKIWKTKKIEADLIMVTKLLDEQKRKIKSNKKPAKNKSEILEDYNGSVEEFSREEEFGEYYEKVDDNDSKIVRNIDIEKTESYIELRSIKEVEHEKSKVIVEEKSHPGQNVQLEDGSTKLIADLDEARILVRQKKKKEYLSLVKTEASLVADPSEIVFSDFVTEKIYAKELKFKNTGTDCLQFKFLRAELDGECEDLNPLRVLVDSCLLRPGLSTKLKITLHTTSTSDIRGKLVFETRKKKFNKEKSYFFVPISCTVPKAVITITPVKISFPCVPWCCATAAKKGKNLKKVLKITNSGGKTCTCAIFKKKTQDLEKSLSLSLEEDIEGEFEIFDSFATEIMDKLISNVFETFRFSEKYCIEVQSHSTKNINVVFSPGYKGFHCETFTFLCETEDGNFEEKIQLTGDIEKLPIRVEPTIIDLKTCIMNSGVYQGVFTVFNDSAKTFPVTAKIPQCLKNHCHVFPSEPIVQPSGSCSFSVTFYPRSSLLEEGCRYYCRETQLLEFPVLIHQRSSHSCKSEHLKVYVFALITDHCLELHPPHILFGRVTTLETLRKEIYLTNHSLSIQEYGFLNLPKGVRIEPNLGFGRIFPKETLMLYLLFSPMVEHIDKNNLGSPSSRKSFSFNVKVSSIAELGGFGKEDEKSESKQQSESVWSEDYLGEEKSKVIDSASEESKLEFQSGAGDRISSKEKTGEGEKNLPLTIIEKEQKIREFLKIDELSELSFFNRVLKKSDHSLKSDIYNNEEFGEGEEFSVTLFDDRKNKNVILCDSYICNTYCELSSSVIQLPATPCSSFSLTKFYLSGKNASTTSKCYCGLKDKLQNKIYLKMKFYFEFKYDCPGIKIEPQCGSLEYGKVLAITIVFKPEFPVNLLRGESKMQKSLKIFEGMEKEKEAAEVAASAKLTKGKKDKNQKSLINLPKYENPEDILNSPLCVLKKNDFFLGEKNLQQTMSPFSKETRVLCVISGESGLVNEVHEMIIIAPAIKPDFVFAGDSQEISFGKVPTGITSKSILKIQNIKMERIFPSLSILNPFGPFVCPVGKVELDPEHIWNISLAFTPLEETETTEFFEIRSGKTIFSVKVSGAGINPEYLITPDFALSRIEAKKGGFSEFKFDFQNLNEANLPLNFVKEFTKELTTPAPSTQDKQKKKLSKLQTDISQDIIFQLENDYEDVVDGDLIFTIIGFKDEFIVPSFAAINIKIRFQPPGEADKTYVSKYKIILGRNRVLKEFLIFGTVTKGK